MTTVELITTLFYEVDEQMGAIPKHPEALLYSYIGCKRLTQLVM